MLESIQVFLEVYAIPLAVTGVGLGVLVWRIGSLTKAGFKLVGSIIKNESSEERKIIKDDVGAQFNEIMRHIRVLEEKDEIDTMLKLGSKVVPEDVKEKYRIHKAHLDQIKAIGTQAKEAVEEGSEKIQEAITEAKDSNWLDI